MQKEYLLEMFKIEVFDKSSEVDPSSEENWYSLTLGWAIAKGLSPENAHEFSSVVRYQTDMG